MCILHVKGMKRSQRRNFILLHKLSSLFSSHGNSVAYFISNFLIVGLVSNGRSDLVLEDPKFWFGHIYKDPFTLGKIFPSMELKTKFWCKVHVFRPFSDLSAKCDFSFCVATWIFISSSRYYCFINLVASNHFHLSLNTPHFLKEPKIQVWLTHITVEIQSLHLVTSLFPMK